MVIQELLVYYCSQLPCKPRHSKGFVRQCKIELSPIVGGYFASPGMVGVHFVVNMVLVSVLPSSHSHTLSLPNSTSGPIN